jgi:hypothetical protein
MLLNNLDNNQKDNKKFIDKNVSNIIQSVEKDNVVHFDDSMHGNINSEEISDIEDDQVDLKLTK